MRDIIVVGASFAGLMTAIAASKSSKVLLIEKRKEPGTPINTTGAVPIEWMTKMGVYPSEECIAGNLRGFSLVAPNGESVLVKNPKPDGMVLYPDRFVKWLAEKAKDRGCEIMTDTVFNRVSFNGKAAQDGTHEEGGISIETSRGTFRSKYVVGADGAASPVGRSVGLGSKPRPDDMHIGLEYTVENNHVQDPEIFTLFLGHDVAPLGYAWSFPEGPDHLKVGLGIPQSTLKSPKRLMERFFAKNPQFRTAVSKSNGGMIPTAPPLKTAVKGNVVLVGDAGHFCSPLHGGGIWFGMLSGLLAGNALAHGKPALYDRLWKSQLAGVLSRHYKLKRTIYTMSDRDFNALIRSLNAYVDLSSTSPDFARSVQKVFLSDPAFVLTMALKSSRSGLALDVLKRMLIPNFRIA